MRWNTFTGLGLGILGAAVLWRGYTNTKRLALRTETVIVPDLPAAFDGFRLFHITDMHLRQDSPVGEELLALVTQLDPDLVCLTGDYAFTALSLDDVESFFARLSERPAVGVYGNADYRPDMSSEMRAGWSRFFPFLSNSALALERQGETLWVAGVDDPHLGRDSLYSALESVPEDAPVILLAHSPEIIQRPLDPRIRLILSGHTHGGQICLPSGQALYHNTGLPASYSSGRHDVNGATLYVSRGIGSTRLPLRYGCVPEVTLFTLWRGGEDV
ncbi:MAG TPA: metallophosphoesterase [Armatimonadota bacterium]